MYNNELFGRGIEEEGKAIKKIMVTSELMECSFTIGPKLTAEW